MTDPSLMLLARQTADRHSLDQSVVCAIIEQESDWNPAAVRYEAAFYNRYIAPMNLLDSDEAHKRATSFGLMQIMGETAREHGYPGPLEHLLEPATGLEWGCIHFASLLKKAGGDVYAALLHYNGGSNTLYPGQVIARMDKYIIPPDLNMMEEA